MSHMTRQTGSPHLPRIMSQLANQPPYPTQYPYQPQHQYHQQQMPYPMQQHPSHPFPNSQQQETSFITLADTEAAVTKINTMFPTANDVHIRMLLKK